MKQMMATARESNWLAAGALWAVAALWAAVGVHGWIAATTGILTVLLVGLTIALQVFGVRALKNAADVDDKGRKWTLIGLGGACLAFAGYSGHQGIKISEAARWAPYDAFVEGNTATVAFEAKIAAVPMVSAFDAQGRRIGPQTMQVLVDQRAAELARLETQRPAPVARVAKPATRLSALALTLLAILIEALEGFGFYAISRRRKIVAAVATLSPAMSPSELGRNLVAMRKDRRAAA